MKKLASLLLVALFAGAITLGAYKLFFENSNYEIIQESDQAMVFNTSYTPTSPRGAGINEIDFTVAAENTINAVVHVKSVTTTQATRSPWDFIYGSEGGKRRKQVGSGSGVVISADGHIVTNHHVIAKSEKLQVTLNNNKIYDAVLIGSDPNTDIALIKIEAERKLPYLAFGDSDNTKIGEWVLAVGNPFNLTSTVTAGIISAKARDLGKNQSFIQTDAAVNPGNSGGALVNTNGDLVGINTAITSQTGSYVGYSFAVPSNIAKKIVEDIIEYGSIQKGLLGVSSPNLNTPYAREQGYAEIEGVFVSEVEPDSGADKAEILEGDIIKQIDNIKVKKFADLTGYLSTKRPKDTVQITLKRGDDELFVAVILKERQTLVIPHLGFKIKNLTDEDRKTYKTDKGVKIVEVPETYRGHGLENKILLSLDNKEINNIQDANNLFSQISKYGKTSITMINKKGEKERLIFQ